MSLADIRLTLEEKPYLWAYIAGSVLLLVCSILWWFTVYIGPRHVFWSMINNSLATSGVVMQSSQKGDGDDRLKQLIHLDTTAQMARSLTTLRQGATEIKTEILGTKTADYTRYAKIASNTKADTSSLMNVWAKSDNLPQTESQVSGHQLYAQATLGIGLPLGSVPVPVGKLTHDQRTRLYEYIRIQQVYQPNFSKVKKERVHGRLLYTYDVKLQTVLYVSMMKAFAKDLGLKELEGANPNSYSDTPSLQVSLTVDALSHQLVRVAFAGADGFSQLYESYGQPLKVTVPKQTITAAELQKRLTELGGQAQ